MHERDRVARGVEQRFGAAFGVLFQTLGNSLAAWLFAASSDEWRVGVVGRDAIMAAVWPDVVVGDESITQCVRDVRRALSDEAQTRVCIRCTVDVRAVCKARQQRRR